MEQRTPIGIVPPDFIQKLMDVLPTAAILLLVTSVLVVAYALGTRRDGQRGAGTLGPLLRVVLDGQQVASTTGALFQKSGKPPPKTVHDLLDIFDPQEEHIKTSITNLINTGTRFDEVVQCINDDLVHVTGKPSGMLAEVSIFASSPISEALYEIQSKLEVLMAERNQLRRRLSNVPMAMLEIDRDKREIWANKHFRTLCDQVRAPDELVRLMKIPSNKPVEVRLPGSGESHWMRIVHRQADDHTIVSAYPADDQHRAETNLRRFMGTLTDTFAHLKVGLAVFDSERKLTLFNPALSEIFNIDATLLIANPSLREFLEAIRQKRMVPEMRNFSEWRDRITALDETLGDGNFIEEWSLPSGQILQVTGRPHPDGALALLFEDITSSITIERRYRAEIEMGQGTLDSLPDSVAVIDTSGAMIFANIAFEKMWDIDGMSQLEAPTLTELIKVFTKSTKSDDIWTQLRRFVQSSEIERKIWSAEIPLANGNIRYARFSILPGGATMMLFRDHGNRSTDIDPLATDAAVPFAPFTGMGEHARLDLDLSAIELALSSDPSNSAQDWTAELLDRVRAFFAARHMTLETSKWNVQTNANVEKEQLRRLMWCLSVSAAGYGTAGSVLSLSGTQNDQALEIALVVHTNAANNRSEDFHKFKRMIADMGGELSIEPSEDALRTVFRCKVSTTHRSDDQTQDPLRSAS